MKSSRSTQYRLYAICVGWLLHLTLVAQTTEEEYLYVSFGYKEQLLNGLDDKKGYSWKQLSEYKFVYDNEKLIGRKSGMVSIFSFEGLYRAGETKPCAIVAIYREKESLKKRDGVFICLPHPKSGTDIFAKVQTHFEKTVDFNSVQLRHYGLALGRLATTIAQF
jgi:hypothetical protein